MDKWLISNGESAQYVLFFSLLLVLGVVESAAPARKDRSRGARWVSNFGLTALNVVTLALLPVSFVGISLWAAKRDVGLFHLVALPLALLIPAQLLARGFVSWLTHLLMHRVPLLWRVHRVHHLDTELDVSTTVRFHPLEFAVGLVTGIPLIMTFGLSPAVLLAYEILDVAVTLFSHANLRLPARVERVLRYFVVTPDLHRVHHSSWQPETDSNFSAVFPVWDLVFGTLRTTTREPQETMQLGLEEVRDARTHNVLWLLSSPAATFTEADRP